MYQTSLIFKIKDSATDLEKQRILVLFFKSWIDDLCKNKVFYEFNYDHLRYRDLCKVEFEHSEDAVVLKLKGIPDEFSQYIEFVN